MVRLSGSAVETVVDGLQRPQGILVPTDSSTSSTPAPRSWSTFDLSTGARHTIASGLPVGPPPGVVPKPLKGMPPFSGPQGPFAGITIGPDGTLFVSADGDGSVLALRRVQ